MVTKRMIYDWLDTKEQEAVDLVSEGRQQAREDFLGKLYEKLTIPELAKSLYPKFQELYDTISNWKNTYVYNTPEISNIAYYRENILSSLEKVVEEKEESTRLAIIRLFDVKTNNCKELVQYDRTYENCKDSIHRNYASLRGNIKLLKNAKEAVEYMKSLGINVSDLESLDVPTTCTALSTNIDTKYLFISK